LLSIRTLLEDERERMAAAHEFPAVILAPLAAGGLEVDLFPVVLADVGDVEIARLPVEGKRPGGADTVGPDFGLGSRVQLGELLLADAEEGHLLQRREERVVLGDVVGAVRAAFVHVDAKNLAEQRVQILASIDDIALPPAVAHADIEVAVWAE